MKIFRFSIFLLFALLSIEPKAQYKFLPDNIFADDKHAPFVHGIASGDPLQTQIIIWTRISPSDTNQEAVKVNWQMATDSNFLNIANQGVAWALKSKDFTVKVDADKLNAGSNYFYRFEHNGKFSAIGNAKTLPSENVQHIKFAVASCSSIWSGYFNAYQRIAERKDIDYVIHLGDYAYDYADKDELIRIPDPFPKDVSSLSEWRERHRYYLLDPNLRAAKQSKTWFVIWDNHDTDCEKPGTTADAIQAFYEYLPIRVPDTTHLDRVYRSFRFGALAQLNLIDMHLFRGKEEYAPGEKSVLGNLQDAWLKNELKQSTSKWNLIGNQEMMGSWMSEGLPKFLKVPGNGKVFDPGNWDGFPKDRERLYNFIKENIINNVVVLTGDAHMSFVMNLTATPKNRKLYHRRTGKGAVGVEFLPTSITRGNMDENGIPKEFIPMFQSISRDLNPHHRFNQFSKHGYGTLDVTPQRCVAEFWYSPILTPQSTEQFGRGYTVLDGKNHWERKFNRSRKKSTYPLMH
jgi:alkaline phosphatase D